MSIKKNTINRAQYLFKIFVVPTIAGLLAFGLVYFLVNKYNQDKDDLVFGLLAAISVALYVYFKRRFNWTKMPDGTYFNSASVSLEPKKVKRSPHEPAEYHAVFHYSKIGKIANMLSGLFLIGLAILLYALKAVFLPIILFLGGSFFIYYGLKDYNNQSPKLKLAKEGLWTEDLGFVSWDAVHDVKIEDEYPTQGGMPTSYLSIYLDRGNHKIPTDQINLNDLFEEYRVMPLVKQFFKKNK